MPNFLSIQYLRAFAALAVLAFHLTARLGQPAVAAAAGVDVFFVISGFIMWTVTAARPTNLGTFLWHRLVRIAPPYWAITLAMVAAAAAIPGLFPTLRAPLPHVAASLLFIPHADPAGTAFPVLVPGWTLEYEMLFYALFAAVLALRRRAAALTAALALLVAAGLVLRPAGVLAATYTDPVLLEFAAGLWLGVATRAGRLPGRRTGWVLVAGSLAAFAAQFALPHVPDSWRVLSWGLPATALVAGALAVEGHGGVFRWRPLLLLGDASYALYLLHGLVVSVAWAVAGRWPAGFLLLGAAGSVAAACAFHLALERPVTGWLRGLPRRMNAAWVARA